MFKVIVCGGRYDGDYIDTDGWHSSGGTPIYRFTDYADAQEFIDSRDGAINRGDFGVGATLNIDEIDGDIY